MRTAIILLALLACAYASFTQAELDALLAQMPTGDMYMYEVDEYDSSVVAMVTTMASTKSGTQYTFTSRNFGVMIMNMGYEGESMYSPSSMMVSAKFAMDYNEIKDQYADINAFIEDMMTKMMTNGHMLVGGIGDLYQWTKGASTTNYFSLADPEHKILNMSSPMFNYAYTAGLNVMDVSELPSESCGADCELRVLSFYLDGFMPLTSETGPKVTYTCKFIPETHKDATATVEGFTVDYWSMPCKKEVSGLPAAPTGYTYGLLEFTALASVDQASVDNVANTFFNGGGYKYEWKPTATLNDVTTVDVYNTRMHEDDEESFMSHMIEPAKRSVFSVNLPKSMKREDGDITVHVVPQFITFGTESFTKGDYDVNAKLTAGYSNPFPPPSEGSSATSIIASTAAVVVAVILAML
jgi:hypothetical protein